MLDRIAQGPDREAAGVRLERFREAGGAVPDDAEGQALLAAVVGSGSYLPDLLIRSPARLPELLADPWLRAPRPAADLRGEAERAVAQAHSFGDLQRALRRVATRDMLRLGVRELGWGSTDDVATELAQLADACLDASVTFCDADLRRRWGPPESDEGPPGFVVLGLGKLGGQELNFSSDVDLIYVYASDAGQAGRHSLHEYYAELSEQVTRAIDETTADGRVFRVDLRLRPEGRAGAICNAIAASERYYETFGRTWERQALLRARPAAGDRAVGDELLATLDAFIHPRHLDPGMVDEVRALRRLFRAKADAGGFDVKLGAGGIRDVELVAQTLQLLHAGKRRDLRERHTPRALQRLVVAGLLTDRELRVLLDAYRFLRHLEHLLQIEDGAQTHLLRADEAHRQAMARRMGLPDAAALEAALGAHRARVEDVAASFGEPEEGGKDEILRLLDPICPREQVLVDLANLGFERVEAGADALDAARGRFLPSFLEEAAASPDPDRALVHLRDLALHASPGLRLVLRDSPQLLRMLTTLFGTSDRLSRLLLARPSAWDGILQGLGEPERTRVGFEEALEAERGAESPDDEEAALAALGRLQAQELLRIGLHDVAGSLRPAAVGSQLTRLAGLCVERALELAWRGAEARMGRPRAALTVLGLGSIGAREMRYGSDLDLVLLYDDEGTTLRGVEHAEFFARLAQRLIGALGTHLGDGRLYDVDMRLRPSGEQGLLVTTWAAFERHHHERAALWERVALLRARPVAGRGESRAAVEARLRDLAYGPVVDEALLRAELVRLRRRMEEERAGKRGAVGRHLRFAAGGLADVEFVVALLQLRLASEDPALRTTSVRAALARLAARGLPSPEAGRALGEDHAFLEQVLLRLRLRHDRTDDVVGGDDLAPLGRMFGLGADALGAELDRRMARVRATFRAVVG